MKNYKPMGLWNAEGIEAIYDYAKIVLNITHMPDIINHS